MKSTEQVASDLYDRASQLLLIVLLSPLLLLAGLAYAPFWICAKLYTTFIQKETQ